MAIEIRALLDGATELPVAKAIPSMPSLPADGVTFLKFLIERAGSQRAAVLPQQIPSGDLLIGDHRDATSSWYSSRRIAALICDGDLIIEGDLIDDDYASTPALIVSGSLRVRNWLRGGLPCWVGHHVSATGLVIGKYNDAPLFVGGNLEAAGYVRCTNFRMPEPDMEPHQIAGKLRARTLDLMDETIDLRSILVDEVLRSDLDEDEVCTFIDEDAALRLAAQHLSIWRDRHE